MTRKTTGMARVLVMLALVLCFAGVIHAGAISLEDLEDSYIDQWEEYGKPETGMTLVNRGTILPWEAKYGLLDANGNTVLPPVYSCIEYAAGKLIVERFTGLGSDGFYAYECALMDLKGNILYGFSENGISLVDRERGLFAIGSWNQSRLYDSNLNLLPTPAFYGIEPAGEESPDDYVITVYVNDSSYLKGLYRYGVGMILPCQYFDLWPINENLYGAAKDKDHYGVITERGVQVLPYAYDFIAEYRNGYFIVGQNVSGQSIYGLVDRENSEILPCAFGPMSFLENGNVWLGVQTGWESVGFMEDIELHTPTYDYYEYELEQPPFEDVAISSYFCQPIRWAVDENITTGTSATTFSPYTTCTTGQILTFLWRANGSPDPDGSNAAVPAGQYYSDAVNWAYENGLISGSTFNAAAPCTRSATVTYLWKLAGSPAADAAAFTDVAAEAEYAQAVAWAVAEGITTGSTATTFSPDNTCTRGQIVTFLYRAFA